MFPILNPPPSSLPFHPSGLSQCTSPNLYSILSLFLCMVFRTCSSFILLKVVEKVGWHHILSGREWKTGEADVLQFMGSQRVGHDLATEQQNLKWVSCGQHAVGSSLLIHSGNLCLLTGTCRALTFKVIIVTFGWISTTFVAMLYLLPFFFLFYPLLFFCLCGFNWAF